MQGFDRWLDSGRMSMFLLFAAFVVTFVITRTITRMIRAGRGPFRNNISDGLHIHHAVPGIILTIVGAFISVAVGGAAPGAQISAVMIGIGASLVLDEFALILRLQDVYWAREGQLSVQVVALTVAALGMGVLGVNPLHADAGITVGSVVLAIGVPINAICVLCCVAKGKFSTAVLGAFIPMIAWAGAIRLARPRSRWARHGYSERKVERATRRAQEFDARFGRWGLSIGDLVAGKPSESQAPTSLDRPAVD